MKLSTILGYGGAIIAGISSVLILGDGRFFVIALVAAACSWYGFYLRGRGQ